MTKTFDQTRRKFIKLSLATAACSVATPALATVPRISKMNGTRVLNFHNLHTDERLQTVYWQNGGYDRAALEKINHILRDHYSGDSCAMNVQLVDLLYDLQLRLNNDKPVEIISGYRSPRTNMMLASLSDGVAKNSYHTKGMAMDIRMTGTSLSKLHTTALAMRRGGVGYYPDSQFVHIDVGPIRTWG
jgi:uncharacterized protein YcbK (DUF882 family)